MADIPKAPKHRPDLAATWGIVAQMEKRSEAGYRDAAQRIRARVAGYGHIGAAELAEIQRMIDAELGKLAAQQNGLLFQGMAAATAAAALGVRNGVPDAAAEQLLVRHLVDKVHSDGLNLSARLWRVHQGAAQDMKSIVDVAVQRGWSAEKALQHTMEITPELRQALEEAGSGAIAQRLENGLLHDSGNAAAKFRRVLRTEINTAHGERYKQMVRDDPEAVGLRFMLSPRHPRVDICDTHATADLYNLGPGVYPVDACPWPAHPNTFSYIEVVFEDEVGSPNPSVMARHAASTEEFQAAYHDSFEKSYQSLQHHVAVEKARGLDTQGLRDKLGMNKKWVGATLSREQKAWLNTTADKVLISDDTLIKQFAHHAGQPIHIEHYRNLQQLLDNAAVVVRSSEQSVAFFRQDERVMKAVLKTTKDRSEVYLTTLHVSDESAIRRALKKNAVIKNEYGGV